MEKHIADFLKGKNQNDFILNPKDLPEHHVRLSQLLEEYHSFKDTVDCQHPRSFITGTKVDMPTCRKCGTKFY